MRVEFRGQIHEFPDNFTDEQVRKALKSVTNQENKSSWFDQAAAGFKDAAVTGAGGVISGLSAIEGMIGGEGKEDRVRALLDAKKNMEQYWAKPENDPAMGEKPRGAAQAVARGAGGIPQYLHPAVFGPQLLGRAMQESEDIINQGGSLGGAYAAGGSSLALNSAAMALPPAFGGSLKARAATGAGMNVGSQVVDQEAQNVIRRILGLKEKDPLTSEDLIAAATLGAGFGAAASKPVKDKTPPPAKTKEVLDAADAKKAATATGGPFWKGGGDVITPESLTPGRLPEFDRAGLPPDVPQIPTGEAPLPDLNTIQDMVPLLPDTPMIQEGVQGERPLPTIDPRLAKQSTGLSLIDQTGEMPPMGAPRRDSRGDMHNMAEGMDTIDFPLRQEVLEQPEIKQAIDNFRMEADRLMAEGDQAGLDQLTRDFTAGMQRLGIARPQDAFGRGLYEGGEQARYLETGIQRTGDRNTNLATMPETKQLPLGGEQPKPAEVSAIRQAFEEWKKWRDNNARSGPTRGGRRQSGFIHPSLLGIGKVADLIKKLGNEGTWKKFKGTFHSTEFERAQRNALDPNSRETLVWLSPDDFLRLAVKRPPSYMEQEAFKGSVIDQKRTGIREGLDSDEGLADIPYFWIVQTPENPYKAYVVGHEGRHRADIFKEKGVDKYPVRLILSSGSGTWKDKRFASIQSEGDGEYLLPFPQKIFNTTPFVPKSQRGSLDVKAISDGVNELITKIKKGFPKSVESVKAAVVEKAVGWKQTYITEAEEFTPELKQKFVTEGNTSNPVSRAVTPGRVAMQELQGRTNELIAWAGRHLENARNRYEILRDDVVEPIKRAMRPIIQSENQLKSLSEVFVRELQNKERYSEDVLKQALSPKALEAYKFLRDGMDGAREIINATRRAKGLKEISMLDAYLGAMWLGPWKARVYDANNNLVWIIAEPNVISLGKAKLYLKASDPTLKFVDVKYDAKAGKAKGGLDAAFQDLITLLGKDDLVTQTVGELLAKRYLGETMNIGGVEQHFKRKTGVGGYAGNRPWAHTFKDQQAMFEQQIQYIDNVLRWGEQQKVLAKIDEAIKDPDIAEKRGPDIAYIKELIKAEQGRDVNEIISKMEDALGKYTGMSPRHYMQGLGMSKSYFYLHKLVSVPFMAMSLIQPYISVMPALFAHKADVGTGMFRMVMDGYYMAFTIVGSDFLSLGGPKMQKFAEDIMAHQPSELSREAVNYARANRVVELSQMSDVRDVTMPAAVETTNKVLGSAITLPEAMARSQAYMAFVHGLKNNYDTSTHEGRLRLFEKAAEATKESMGDYNPAQKSFIFQRFGMVGNAASALQTFMMNHAYQTYKYAKMAAKGDPMPFISQTALQILFAGATGLIFVDDAEDLLQNLKASPLLPHKAFMVIKDWSVKDFIGGLIGENASAFTKDAWAHGLVSTLTGLNLYSRLSTADMIRAFPADQSVGSAVESYAPYVVDTAKQIGAVGTLAFGSGEIPKKEALNTLMPTGLKGIYEETLRRGENVIPRPGQQTYGSVRRDPEDALTRQLGFRPMAEQRQLDEAYAEKTKNATFTKRYLDLRKKFTEGVIAHNPDEIVSAIKRAVEMGGDPSSWLSDKSVRQIYTNAYLPMVERELAILGKKKQLTPAEAKRFDEWRKIYLLNK